MFPVLRKTLSALIPEKPVVDLKYFLRVKNLGDRISPLLVEKLLGVRTRWIRHVETPHLVAAGSLIEQCGPNSAIWGAGAMFSDRDLPNIRLKNILALRGKLTAQRISQKFGPLKDFPLGDPGFLAPSLCGISKGSPEFELGVVPHYVDKQHPIIRSLMHDPTVAVLDIQTGHKEFFAQMAKCQAVVSTSLHGIIFAEALGLPNAWLSISDEVAGDGFKFHDWFSLCESKQQAPIKLEKPAPAKELISQCEVRNPAISKDELTGALKRIEIERFATRRKIYRPFIRQAPTPIFIISFNRGAYLERIIPSYRRFNRRIHIVIHDNGSDDPYTVKVLNELSGNGIQVVRRDKIQHPDDLNLVDETVSDYFANWSEPAPYVVTDCDIDMSMARTDVLDVFEEFLNRYRNIDCVGPMLRIRDIPQSYPIYNRVMNRHIEQFWKKRPSWHEFPHGKVAAQRAIIDTTFAMYRAGEPYRRLKSGYRVYAPFEAVHLDWYVEDTAKGAYAQTASNEIAHWNTHEQFETFSDTKLEFEEFIDVVLDDGGAPCAKIVKLQSPVRAGEAGEGREI